MPFDPGRRALVAGAAAQAAVLLAGVVAVGVDSKASRRGARTAPRRRHIEEFRGAGGRGKDDTDALASAFDAVRPGDTLVIPTGTYRHRDVLLLSGSDVVLTGGGTLVATQESRSALIVRGENMTIRGLTFATPNTTRRWFALEQHRLVLDGCAGITVDDVVIDGSAAAGVFTTATHDFALTNLRVTGTRADGITMTGASHDGMVVNARTAGTGDDGVSVVSYLADGTPCSAIRIVRPTVIDVLGGRGVTVVGGRGVTIENVDISRTAAAGLYVACEGAPYFTFSARDVNVSGGTIVDANTNPDIDHGAVLLFAGRAGGQVQDVHVSDLRISGTRVSASGQLGVVAAAGATISDVAITDTSLTGGGPAFRASGNEQHSLSHVTDDGMAVS